MGKKLQRQSGKDALDLVEEAVNLVRNAPRGVLACYYIGALPYLLGLLYFWADMSRGAFADEHLAGGALGVGLLFLWMKCWHAVFARGLRARLSDEPLPHWNFARVLRLVVVQTALQPSGLIVRPLALVFTIPYAWMRAFYHSVTVLGDGESASVRAVARASWRQAKLWPRQNHLALAILFVFGIFIWLNVTIAIVAAPHLLKMFTGVETMFTKSLAAVLNSTFLAATGVGAYLFLNPITTALYTLRCFYGESLETGEDLRTSLKMLAQPAARAAATVVLIFFSLNASVPAAESAAKPAPAASSQPMDADALDRSLGEVLERPEFSWRMPRESVEKNGPIDSFLESLAKTLGKWCRAILKKLQKVTDWIGDWLFGHDDEPHKDRDAWGWAKSMRAMLYAAVPILVCAIVWFVWKTWRNRRSAPVAAAPVAALPDLASEETSAAQLPEDGWLRLAREMTERGDLRLALRALYLAGLAHLGARELIAIARYKSNLDYGRELHRRARGREPLLDAFDESVGVFERAWYGMHAVSRETLDAFMANLERIRAHR